MINVKYANSYCSEDISNIENYELAIADDSQCWDLHHRLEIHEDYINSREDLKLMNIYYDRPASELIFIPHSEHISMHCKLRKGNRNPCYGRKRSEETKLKISKNNWMHEKGTGENCPNWKADSKNPLTIYHRGYRMYKRGEITEREFQKYRDILSESKRILK